MAVLRFKQTCCYSAVHETLSVQFHRFSPSPASRLLIVSSQRSAASPVSPSQSQSVPVPSQTGGSVKCPALGVPGAPVLQSSEALSSSLHYLSRHSILRLLSLFILGGRQRERERAALGQRLMGNICGADPELRRRGAC